MSIIERAISKTRSASGKDGEQRHQFARPAAEPATAAHPAATDATAAAFVPRGEPLVLDPDRLEANGLLAPTDARSRLTSQYRSVRRVLLDRLRGLEAQVGARSRAISVCSAVPGEGKTFTSFNLAVSLSQDPLIQVLLVDVDLPKRSLTRGLELQDRPGLSECLLGADVDPLDLCLPVSERLSILPGGRDFVAAGDRLATQVYPQLLDRLLRSSPNLVLVLDTGPLLVSAEAEVAVSRAGAALLVVRAGSTTKESVSDAIRRIPGDVAVGVLLNAWQPGGFSSAESQYGDYYSY